MAIHGWSGDCQSNSGVQGIGGGIAVAIHGWSGDCQINFGVRGYSDIAGYSSGYPYSDIGGVIKVGIHRWSGDCQSLWCTGIL